MNFKKLKIDSKKDKNILSKSKSINTKSNSTLNDYYDDIYGYNNVYPYCLIDNSDIEQFNSRHPID